MDSWKLPSPWTVLPLPNQSEKLLGPFRRQRQNMVFIDGLRGVTEARELFEQYPLIFAAVHFA